MVGHAFSRENGLIRPGETIAVRRSSRQRRETVLDKPEDLRIARQVLRAGYRDALTRLAQILLEEDPIGINFGDNDDEYDPERWGVGECRSCLKT